MPSVGRRVSFSIVIALLLGWGIFGLLFIQTSATLLQAQVDEADRPVPLPPGVRLNLQVDKKVYRAGESVLMALRNDSRLPVWLAAHADGCAGSWWRVEVLTDDAATWKPVAVDKDTCSENIFGLTKIARHTLQSAVWTALVSTDQLGNIVVPAPTGTYRIAVPFLKGGSAKEADWGQGPAHQTTSPSFTIQ